MKTHKRIIWKMQGWNKEMPLCLASKQVSDFKFTDNDKEVTCKRCLVEMHRRKKKNG